jgi:hypothetical protein
MEFVLNFLQPINAMEAYADPAKAPALLQPWQLYMDSMKAAGVLRGGNRLEPFSTTAVRVRDGKRQVQDGPFVETKDLLGGYVLIDVPSVDEALKWAERSPSSLTGSTEVRSVIQMADHA